MMKKIAYAERVDLQQLKAAMEDNIAKHRGWYIFQGLLFILLGATAIILPQAMAIGMDLLIGALLIVSGLAQGFSSMKSRTHWWATLSAFLSIIVGGIMLWQPLAGTAALATLVAIFLLLEGVVEIFLAFVFRPIRFWIWLLASGLIALSLALFVLKGGPNVSIWFLGIFIGVNLILYGISLLALTTASK